MKKILIINNTLDPNNFERIDPIKNVIGNVDTIHFTKQTKSIIDSYDAIILSGAAIKDVKGISKRLGYYNWLKNTDKPVLGICAGHHVIGQIFGAKKFLNKVKSEGHYTIYIDTDDPMLSGVEKKFFGYKIHRSFITLPKDFVLLGHSRVCKVEIMKHKEKPIYGVQFHPELSQKKILKKFLNLI